MSGVVRQCWCGADDLEEFGGTYLRCKACDTLVGQAGLSDDQTRVVDDTRDYYGRRYWLEHQTEELGLPDIYARARSDLPERCVDWLRILLRYRRPPAKVLEVGAGHGAYTALLQWTGFEAVALDLSPWTADFARDRFAIPYLVGPVEDQALEPASFDVLVANDVLEHLAAPGHTVSSWARLLKPGGLFVFQTPEFVPNRTYAELVATDDLFLQHMDRARDEHLFLFSRDSLTRLLADLGLRSVAFDEPVYPYDMFGVASGEPLAASDDEPAAILGSSSHAPLVLALLDAREAWRAAGRDSADRLVVIEQLDAALRSATSPRPRGGLGRGQLTKQRQGTTSPLRSKVIEPTITIITPVFNGADFIEECIESVLQQNYLKAEYGIVDGGSTDGTLEIVRRYESRLAFWTSEPDRGQADALNKGFRRATGAVVGWLNADDFLYPDALAAVADAYLDDPEAPFYFGNGLRVDRDGKKISEFFPDGRVEFRRDALLFGLNYILQPAAFIRRDALEQVGLLDVDLHYGFDTDVWAKLSALGRPRPIRRRIAASREYATTKTATGSFERAEELRRIAERHAFVAATPGSVCYYLDTLHRVAKERGDVFPGSFVRPIESFWAETAQLLGRYGARSDGFPLTALGAPESIEPRLPSKAGGVRVGVELRYATRGDSGGIVAVLAGTLTELFRRHEDVEFVVFCTVFNRELLSADAPNVELVTLPLDRFFPELDRLVSSLGIDVLFRSYPTVEQSAFPLSRQIFLIPDLQHDFFPNFFDAMTLRSRRAAFEIALDGAGAIMTISDFSRDTIATKARRELDVFVAKPSLPAEFLAARSEDVTHAEAELVPAGEFFFYPANLWPHKNHDRMLEAFRRFRDRTGSQAEFVLTGSHKGWAELRDRHLDLPVRHLGYVSAPLLKLLYGRALALTLFSLYEGFGIPVLEAFESGAPVLCSNTTSLPEVAGDAALMCDPEDTDEVASLMERIAGSADLRAELIARGKERVGAFRWGDAADELARAVERVRRRAEAPALDELPLVSIVTPSYNQGRFIRATIESVLAQTYPNIEYLVVDGASTDETVAVLESLGDRVRWLSEPDTGQAAAINKGLRLATGEILGYLNSDDVLLPQAIESVVRHFRTHPECDLVYGDADYVDENGKVIAKYETADYSFERLMNDCCICQPAAYWRAAAGDVVGGFDEELQYAMDYDYWIRTDRSGLVIQHMPVTIAQSRLHAGAKTLRARREIYREIFRVCRERGGYISRSYVYGFWHHLTYEGWLGRALRLPRIVPGAATSFHYRWLNRHVYFRLRASDGVGLAVRRRVAHRLQGKPRLLSVALRLQAGARPRRRAGVSSAAQKDVRVRGFWTDNWVGDRLDVLVDPSEHGRTLNLVGRPVSDMTLSVSSNGDELGRFELNESCEEDVCVDLPAGHGELITFTFSDHAVDAQGRPLAFLLQQTNIFREDDLYTLG
jgi:glycosyltransferase involved in cell wall biosynthesis/2-polyprenyl-3-methyl-5-hydroxy-6-metoxy-1,4-benzoquinol methylase